MSTVEKLLEDKINYSNRLQKLFTCTNLLVSDWWKYSSGIQKKNQSKRNKTNELKNLKVMCLTSLPNSDVTVMANWATSNLCKVSGFLLSEQWATESKHDRVVLSLGSSGWRDIPVRDWVWGRRGPFCRPGRPASGLFGRSNGIWTRFKDFTSFFPLFRSSVYVFLSSKNKGNKGKVWQKGTTHVSLIRPSCCLHKATEMEVNSVLALVFQTKLSQSSGLIGKSKGYLDHLENVGVCVRVCVTRQDSSIRISYDWLDLFKNSRVWSTMYLSWENKKLTIMKYMLILWSM